MTETTTIDAHLHQLAQKLIDSNRSLVIVESCTGGLISSAVTDIPGSSQWFWGAFITYANEAKTLLGVPQQYIQDDGAVSESVARSMAENAAHKAGVAVALSVTGIAGPDGGTAIKPVGTVCFGWYVDCHSTSEQRLLKGDRTTIRTLSLAYSIAGLLARMTQGSGS